MKKIFFVFLFVFAIGFGTISVYAEEIPNVVDISDMINDKDGWSDLSEAVKFEKDKLIREHAGNGNVIVYKNKSFTNEMLEFKVKFKGRKFFSVILRENKDSATNMWNSSHSYAFNIYDNSIELQKYKNGQTQISHFPCKTDENATITIRCGIINVGDGAQVVFYVNGEQIINYYDSDNAVTDGGYLAFHIGGETSVEIMPTDNKELDFKPIPVQQSVSEYDIGTTALEGSYSVVGSAEGMKLNWYRSEENFFEKARTTAVSKEEVNKLFTKIDGYENKDEYMLSPDDNGKYISVGIEDKNGNISYSKPTYIDPVKAKIAKSIFMVDGYERALLFGNLVQIDADNEYVSPESYSGVLYIPLRFAVESFGGNISWEESERKVSGTVNQKNFSFVVDGQTELINDKSSALSSPTVISEYGRTMISVKDLKNLTGLEAEIFDSESVKLSREKTEFTDEELEEIFKTVMFGVIAEN